MDMEKMNNEAEAAITNDPTLQDMENHTSNLSDIPLFEPEPCALHMGDHVYQWCSVAGIPQVFQHHAIVFDVEYRRNAENDDGGEWIAKIADFSNDVTTSCPLFNKQQLGCVRAYECPVQRWRRVEYEASFWKRHTWRAGTCTAVQSDSPGLVRARVQFLMEHPEVLPDYHALRSNCECVAVWCKTGTWDTLQAASWLSVASAGQVKSAVTIAGAAASTQITVPAAGMWGWLGYTTHVSLLATQPLLLPAIVAYGAVTAGTPAVMLALAKKKWTGITEKLNAAFWEQAVENPEVFAECITHWSAQYEPVDGQEKELIPPVLIPSPREEEMQEDPDDVVTDQDTTDSLSPNDSKLDGSLARQKVEMEIEGKRFLHHQLAHEQSASQKPVES